jgi:hypothetical protein
MDDRKQMKYEKGNVFYDNDKVFSKQKVYTYNECIYIMFLYKMFLKCILFHKMYSILFSYRPWVSPWFNF